jgi:hypothetical protein
MMYRMTRAFIASLGVIAMTLAASETFAASGPAHGGGSGPRHPAFRPLASRSLHHHGRNAAGVFWPGDGGYYDGSSTGDPEVALTQPGSGDIHHTYTYDVPWDWAHRYPPAVAPSDRAYIPECPAQTVTVPGADGSQQTVNIVRCY